MAIQPLLLRKVSVMLMDRDLFFFFPQLSHEATVCPESGVSVPRAAKQQRTELSHLLLLATPDMQNSPK